MKKAGIIIMVIGLLISIFTGFNFVTKEKVVDIGTLEITNEKNHGLTWSPVIGLVAIAAGAGIYFMGAKKK